MPVAGPGPRLLEVAMRKALGLVLLLMVVAALSLVPSIGQAHFYDDLTPPPPVPNYVHCHASGGHGSLYVDVPFLPIAPGVHGTQTNFTPDPNEREHNGEPGCDFVS